MGISQNKNVFFYFDIFKIYTNTRRIKKPKKKTKKFSTKFTQINKR